MVMTLAVLREFSAQELAEMGVKKGPVKEQQCWALLLSPEFSKINI